MLGIRRAVNIKDMLVTDNADEVTKASNDKCVPDVVNFMYMIYIEKCQIFGKNSEI